MSAGMGWISVPSSFSIRYRLCLSSIYMVSFSVPATCGSIQLSEGQLTVRSDIARPRWPKRPERPLQRQLLIIIPLPRPLQLGDSSHSVQIGLGSAGEIKVDDDIHSLNVNTASEQIYSSAASVHAEVRHRAHWSAVPHARHRRTGTDQIPRHAVPEIMKHSVPVRLQHLGVRVETRVAELGDFLGEQLDSVGRVAENDGLVNL